MPGGSSPKATVMTGNGSRQRSCGFVRSAPIRGNRIKEGRKVLPSGLQPRLGDLSVLGIDLDADVAPA
jgi:hypothetical protein